MPKRNDLQQAVADFRKIREEYERKEHSEILLTRILEWERQILTEFYESSISEKKPKVTKPRSTTVQ